VVLSGTKKRVVPLKHYCYICLSDKNLNSAKNLEIFRKSEISAQSVSKKK
jgi:hypothetical protein